MGNIDLQNIRVILATDCGSTTTKARFFKKIGNEYRYVESGEAPTTVEAPYEDVTLGVRNAVREVEELTGHKLLSDEGIIKERNGDNVGVDLYVTTSSAGGGLQMMVFGGAKTITAESGERAALGAGAIVMEVLCAGDGVPLYQKIEKTRFLRPDMILLAGGTDHGSVSYVVEMAELIKMADPKARFGEDYKLPIIFAGNVDAVPAITKTLQDQFALKVVDNIRPKIEVESGNAARDAVHELFMEHVMSHAPGYPKLMKWTYVPIMPTPMAEGTMFQLLAQERDVNVIGVGLGGATTNIYSIYRPESEQFGVSPDRKFVRSVSANLGMSYSICNVLKEAGIDNIRRWIPFDISEAELDNILANKMIRPTTIPETLDELIIEQAVARESIRLAFSHHKQLARWLRGLITQRLIGDMFDFGLEAGTYIDMLRVGIIGGTGGLLSHAPRRIQSAIALIDGFQPEGVTKLVQDSVFMIPHLGVVSTVHPKAAYEIFDKDCMIRLGTCVAPRSLVKEGKEMIKEGEEMVKVELNMPDGKTIAESATRGEIKPVPLELGLEVDAIITPNKNCDIGLGNGKVLKTKIEGGVCGVIIDCRGRPSWAALPQDLGERKKTLAKWYGAMKMYPEK